MKQGVIVCIIWSNSEHLGFAGWPHTRGHHGSSRRDRELRLQIRSPPCCCPDPRRRSSWTAQHRRPARWRPAASLPRSPPETPPHLIPSLCAPPCARSITDTRAHSRTQKGGREWWARAESVEKAVKKTGSVKYAGGKQSVDFAVSCAMNNFVMIISLIIVP